MGLTNIQFEAMAKGKINFIVWEGDVLICRPSAIRFLDWLVIQGKGVSGAEGFIFDGEGFTPIMECIIDYSDGDPKQSIDFFKDILSSDSEWQTKPHFIEFVITGL